MARSEIQFQVRVVVPGSQHEGGGKDGIIGYEQMMNTIDRAYDRGKWHGWQEAMAAVRKAAETPATNYSVVEAISKAADTCTLRTDA